MLLLMILKTVIVPFCFVKRAQRNLRKQKHTHTQINHQTANSYLPSKKLEVRKQKPDEINQNNNEY